MFPEFGQFTLVLALLMAAAQAFFGLLGPHLGEYHLCASGIQSRSSYGANSRNG